MYALIKNGVPVAYPYTTDALRADNPNTSFPKPLTDAALATWGVLPVESRPQPPHNPATQNCVRGLPVQEADKWVERWSVVSATKAEVAERAATQSAASRAERDRLLAASDWTQAADAPVDKAAWAAYRQELRDLTKQAGFPFGVVWPTMP